MYSVPVDYAAALRVQARAALDAHPDLVHEWRDDRESVSITFPRRSERGFDVVVEATADGVIVAAGTGRGGTHVHFDGPGGAEEHTARALGLVRDLLSPAMRLRVAEAAGTEYRWRLESFDGAAWRTEETTGLLLWPFWSRRTERVYQNDVLPPR